VDEARRRVSEYVEHYNHVQMNGAIGDLTPADKLNGLAQVIFDERDRKLEEPASSGSRPARRYGRLLDARRRAITIFGLGGE
jgi:hypothetical protein